MTIQQEMQSPEIRPFHDGLLKARGHIVFVLALLTAFGLVVEFNGLADGSSRADPTLALAGSAERLPLSLPKALDTSQHDWGRRAWAYFQNNTQPATGLVNATDKYPSTTMWDVGSSLLALIAAERIGVITRDEFDRRMGQALASLARLPLFDGALPNKAYNTRTLAMVDYNNNVTKRGIGWSALDVARVSVPLGIVSRDYPELAAAAHRVTARWDMKRLTRQGVLYGSAVTDGQTVTHQEGRIGYEEYAAKSLIRSGLDAFQAWRTDDTLTLRKITGVKVPIDNRRASDWGAQVITTSEPYLLDGLEFGFDTRSRILAEQLYRAQMARFDETGILTAVSEGHVDRAPNFLYATVSGNDVAWAVLSDTGKRYDDLRTVSTKTAFAFDALYGQPYTRRLMASVVGLNVQNGGWLEGRYEKSGKPNAIQTANTNAVILESLHYRLMGPIVPRGPA